MTAPVRVVAVTGAPGVGKTEVAARLSRRYDHPCAMVDTDWLACIWPWREDEALYKLISSNLTTVLRSHVAWGARTIVVSGVMLPGRVFSRLAHLLSDEMLHWVFYGLRARQSTLAARIHACGNVQDPELRLSMAHLDFEVAGVPNVRQVLTDDRSMDDIVDEICAAEARDGAPVHGAVPASATATPPSTSNRYVPAMAAAGSVAATDEVPVSVLRPIAERALTRRGVAAEAATACVEALLSAQADNYASHGLIRIPEYCRALDVGELDPAARPLTTRLGSTALLVQGRGALGVLTVQAIQDALVNSSLHGAPGVVAVRDGGHLGRLSEVVRPLAKRGLIVLGFVNYRGTGQKVAPSGSGSGRIATNPLVFGYPATDGDPVVIDLSTSAWSEGAVRLAALTGQPLPDGVLVDDMGAWVRDPTLLYDKPARAALAPLGAGPAGTWHKGYALAVMVELLAGALAGAGVCRASAPDGVGGNGGLFMAFRPEHLGRTDAELLADVRALEAHLSSAKPIASGQPVRLPGRGRRRSAAFRLPQTLVADLRELSGDQHGATERR